MAGAATTAGFLVLVGCGDDTEGDGAAAGDGGDPSSDAAFPVTVQHTFGETEIPTRPERIACLDAYEADIVLALGLAPVAVSYFQGYEDGVAPWQAPRFADPPPELLRYVDGYDIESTAALDPDLILGSFIDDATFDLLKEVAPTVVMDYESDLRDRVRTVGASVGMAAEAEAVVATYDAMIAEQTEAVGLEGRTVAAVGHYAAGSIENLSDPDSFSVLAELGAIPAPSMSEIEPYAAMGLERIDILDADLVLVAYADTDLQAELEAMPLFAALPAVQEGRYLGIIADGDQDVMRARGVLQVPFVLERFAPAVAALDLP